MLEWKPAQDTGGELLCEGAASVTNAVARVHELDTFWRWHVSKEPKDQWLKHGSEPTRELAKQAAEAEYMRLRMSDA